jgi:hypothetical protein
LFIVMRTSRPDVDHQRVVGWEDYETGLHGFGLSPQLGGTLLAIFRNHRLNRGGFDLRAADGPNLDFELVTATWGPDGVNLHRNGVLAGSRPGPERLSSAPEITALRLGGPGSGDGGRFLGDILELRVFDGQLSGRARQEVEREMMVRWLETRHRTLR